MEFLKNRPHLTELFVRNRMVELELELDEDTNEDETES